MQNVKVEKDKWLELAINYVFVNGSNSASIVERSIASNDPKGNWR